jgi:hypothetical protein
MLITFSGVVGSGKSTAAKHTLEALSRSGVRVTYVRFQSLSSLIWGGRSVDRPQATGIRPAIDEAEGASVLRGLGYCRRRLTLARALGYMARALFFRALRLLFLSRTCLVVNRYFYDNLAHYQLTTRAERLYISLLKFLIPAPDLPCVLVASEKSVVARRPNYAHACIVESRAGYQNVVQHFPELIVVRTDDRDSMEEDLNTVLRASLKTRALTNARQ